MKTASPDINPASIVGRFGCLAVALILIILAVSRMHEINVAAWLKPLPPIGRYQIVSGRISDSDPEKTERPEIIKLDTVTGKTWVFMPFKMVSSNQGSDFNVLPNRWMEVDDHWSEDHRAKTSPIPSEKSN